MNYHWRGRVEDAEKTEQVNSEEQQELPLQNVVGLLSHFASRRGAMGAVLGALAGTAPFLMARPAQAAPADLKGSPNIAVKMYQNKGGNFTLCSDGRIWNLDTGAEACSGLSQYAAVPASKFKTLGPVGGRIKGSPNIAVDAFVDKTGTYVLFADGSVRRPNGAAGKEGGATGFRLEWCLIFGGPTDTPWKSDGWSKVIQGAGDIEWKPAWSEPPIVICLLGTGVNKVVRMGISDENQASIGQGVGNSEFIAIGRG